MTETPGTPASDPETGHETAPAPGGASRSRLWIALAVAAVLVAGLWLYRAGDAEPDSDQTTELESIEGVASAEEGESTTVVMESDLSAEQSARALTAAREVVGKGFEVRRAKGPAIRVPAKGDILPVARTLAALESVSGVSGPIDVGQQDKESLLSATSSGAKFALADRIVRALVDAGLAREIPTVNVFSASDGSQDSVFVHCTDLSRARGPLGKLAGVAEDRRAAVLGASLDETTGCSRFNSVNLQVESRQELTPTRNALLQKVPMRSTAPVVASQDLTVRGGGPSTAAMQVVAGVERTGLRVSTVTTDLSYLAMYATSDQQLKAWGRYFDTQQGRLNPALNTMIQMSGERYRAGGGFAVLSGPAASVRAQLPMVLGLNGAGFAAGYNELQGPTVTVAVPPDHADRLDLSEQSGQKTLVAAIRKQQWFGPLTFLIQPIPADGAGSGASATPSPGGQPADDSLVVSATAGQPARAVSYGGSEVSLPQQLPEAARALIKTWNASKKK